MILNWNSIYQAAVGDHLKIDNPVTDCPEDIMEICTVNWSKDPEDRMSSSEAVEKLTAIYGAM